MCQLCSCGEIKCIVIVVNDSIGILCKELAILLNSYLSLCSLKVCYEFTILTLNIIRYLTVLDEVHEIFITKVSPEYH